MLQALSRSRLLVPVLVCVLAAARSAPLAPPAQAQAQAPAQSRAQTQAQAQAATAKPAGLRAAVLDQLADAEEKLTALAQATPAEKLGWRPAAGVRSVGEVFLHVAAANYDIATVWGAKPPAGTDMDAARGIGKGGADKGKTIAALKASFDHLRKSITGLADKDLDREIDFFGQKGTVREALVEAAVHPHEHLGQAIAYARVIGIVPPWTAARQAAQPKSGR
jgi:uncharacterized damage-inducible protein DinB